MPDEILGVDRRVAALGIARMADALGNSFLIIALPLYVSSGFVTGTALGLSESLVTGLVLALFGLVSSLMQPLAGRLSDRAGKRKAFVIAGLLAFSVINLSFVFAHSHLMLLGLRVGQGIAAALTITASVALVSELSTAASRGSSMGVYNSFRLIGFGGGPLIAGVLIEAGPYVLPVLGGWQISGFEAAFGISAFAPLVSVVLVGAMVQDPARTKPSTEPMALSILARDSGRLLDPVFTLGVATFFMSSCIALLSSIEPVVNARLGQGAVLFAVQFAAFIGSLAVVQPLVGRASDRYGRRIFIVVGLLGLAPTTLVQGLVTTPVQMIGARVLQGIAGAMIFAPALALAGDLAREGQAGAQLSVLTVSFGLGISFGQIASGYLIRFGFVVPFAFGAVLALVGVVLVRTQVEKAGPQKTSGPRELPAVDG